MADKDTLNKELNLDQLDQIQGGTMPVSVFGDRTESVVKEAGLLMKEQLPELDIRGGQKPPTPRKIDGAFR